MDNFNLTTPAVLFPAISLLLLAYGNRFLAVANLIRQLKEKFLASQDELLIEQIKDLRKRLYIIRNMQWTGAFSIFLCVLSMIAVLLQSPFVAKYFFMGAVGSLSISLAWSLYEIHLSTNALSLDLKKIEEHLPKKQNTFLPLSDLFNHD